MGPYLSLIGYTSTRADGAFVTLRGEPLPAVPKPKEGAAPARVIIPRAMPTDADTCPNNVSAERQANTMRSMFRIIEEAHQQLVVSQNRGTPM